MGTLSQTLADVLSVYRDSVERGGFEEVEKDLRSRLWLKGEESNPERVKNLGKAAIIRAETVRRAHGLFNDLQTAVAERNRDASLAWIERIRVWLHHVGV